MKKIIKIIFVGLAINLTYTNLVYADPWNNNSGSQNPWNNNSNPGEHYTHGYQRQDGTYVRGYHATNPNNTRQDNWSSRGNVNPYTGQVGTKDPYP